MGHDHDASASIEPSPGDTLFAVAGNPNCGKTTLFNHLTGLRQKVANYPGVTVEKVVGLVSDGRHHVHLLDLPGIYSILPRSEEERIAVEVLTNAQTDLPHVQGALCVVDSTNLQRSLYLVLQVIATGAPVLTVLNMTDELEARGGVIDTVKLSRILGVPVLPVSASRGTGMEDLRRKILAWKPSQSRPRKRADTGDLRKAVARQDLAARIARSVIRSAVAPHSATDRLDRWLLHPVAGPLIFLAVVLFVFQSIFTWAHPLMDGLDHLLGHLSHGAAWVLPDGLFLHFVQNGVIAGVGAVLVFLPQILLLYLLIGLLEQTGYMARAAFVMDRFMSRIGLQGKSFFPLISCFACAVPGIMSTRAIENRQDRIATLFIAPFMTCSARLPVYTLLIGAFIPAAPILGRLLTLQAAALLSLYFFGFLAAAVTARLLKSSILKSDGTPFLLEMPPYRIPTVRSIGLLIYDRARLFVKKAGTIILGVNLVLWLLATFPGGHTTMTRDVAPEIMANTYAGRIGKAIEPVIRPLGFDWRIGVGLLGAQAAREVMVSSMATLYRIEKTENESSTLQATLKDSMTPLSALSLLMYFVFALQCSSTMAVARRETGGWKWPALMFVYMTGLGYMASLIVYQTGRMLGY